MSEKWLFSAFLFFQKNRHFALKNLRKKKKTHPPFFFPSGSNKRGSTWTAKKKILDSEVVRWKIPVSIGFPISFLEQNLTKKAPGQWRDELYKPYIPAGTEFWGVSQHLSPIHSLKLTAQNGPPWKIIGQTCLAPKRKAVRFDRPSPCIFRDFHSLLVSGSVHP